MTEALPSAVDVVVAGTGAAGLVAALGTAVQGARVLAVESGEWLGGTTALSGGRVWIPFSPDLGTPGSPEAAREYLSAVFGGAHANMIDAFVDAAGDMAEFVEAHTAHRFVPCPRYPDYHPGVAGAVRGGRAFDAEPQRLADLVAEAGDLLLPPSYLPITHAEWEAWRFPNAYDWELLEERQREGVVTNGAALTAALIDGSVRAGVQLAANTELLDVSIERDGVTGATVRGPEGTAHIQTRALVLATGGFDGDTRLRNELLPEPLSASASAPTNTGIAMRIARRYDLATENLDQGWWMPMLQVEGDTLLGQPYPRALIRERALPHQIAVNRAGNRFVNEACPYHEFGKAMHESRGGTYPNRDAWLICDEEFREKYAIPGLREGTDAPHVQISDSLAGLASGLGIDPKQLKDTVTRWNEMCDEGRDADFGRGQSHYDRYYGDQTIRGNPNLGEVDDPPFYAMRLVSTTIGSKGGPVTNVAGEALRTDGSPVGGLYTVGNAGAFWTGAGYPGPGATLGIGMTFAYRASVAARTRF